MFINRNIPFAIAGLVVLAILCTGFSRKYSSTDDVNIVMNKVAQQITQLNTASFTVKNMERVDRQMLTGLQDVIYRKKPYACYVRMRHPDDGGQAVYAQGMNNNQVTYRPPGALTANFSFDPQGKTLRKKNHHSIQELGFEYLNSVLQHLHQLSPENFSFAGSGNYRGSACWKIEISNPDFQYIQYKTRTGETIKSIAKSKHINDFMIMSANPDLRSYEKDLGNRHILIPSNYGEKFIIYIRKDIHLPCFVQVFDNDGLYEQYEYVNIKVNPKIDARRFMISSLKDPVCQ